MWNKPVGRGIDYMSIFEIIKQEKPNFSEDRNFTECTVNKLINIGIHCPMTNCRKIVDVTTFEEEHNYLHPENAADSRFTLFLI